jgi:acyl-CoA thioester hydrolase
MEKCMPASYEITLKVPFHDLDPLQVVWHGNYMKYFDIARFGLFEKAGIDLHRYQVEHGFLFPITKTSVKHIAPLEFNDEFICKATVTEARYKLVIAFEIRLAASGKLCARCSSEQVAVKTPSMALEFEIPADIRKAFGID